MFRDDAAQGAERDQETAVDRGLCRPRRHGTRRRLLHRPRPPRRRGVRTPCQARHHRHRLVAVRHGGGHGRRRLPPSASTRSRPTCTGRCMLRTLFKGATTALVLSAITVYFVKSPYVNQSRFLLLGTFGLFFVFSAFLRLTIQAPRLPAQGRRAEAGRAGRRPVGALRAAHPAAQRPARLLARGGASTTRPACDGYVEALEHSMDELAEQGRALSGVFVDADGVPLQAVLPLVDLVRSRRVCSAYVMSDLLRPLHSQSAALHALRGAGHARARQGAQRRRAPRQARVRRRPGLGRPRRDWRR